MARGRQRDEWSRMADLLALVWNRTRFSKEDEAKQPLDFIPPGLIDPAERKRQQAAAKPPIEYITAAELQALMCGNPPSKD